MYSKKRRLLQSVAAAQRQVVVQKQDIGRLLESLDIMKAMGLDRVSGQILRECKDQLIQPIWEVITSSTEEGRVPQEWKRANIVPIYKGGKKTDPVDYGPVTNKCCQQNMRH